MNVRPVFFFVPMVYLGLLATAAYAQTSVDVWTSAADLNRKLAAENPIAFGNHAKRKSNTIVVDDTKIFQRIEGLGSSFEPTTCYNLSLLPEAQRRIAIRRIVHPTDGIGMNLMRICIGTPDFTGDPWYTYLDAPDVELKSFSIDRDKAYILPVLKMALEENPELRFYASPWSPPGWMTSTGDMIGGTLLPEYYETYARYFVKFIQAYAREGIPVHAVTIQNEPGVDRSTEKDPKWHYPSCRWNGDQERLFIGEHLGPLFDREGIQTEIWCYDHNYNSSPSLDGDDPGISYPRTVLRDPLAARYVDKVAFHGYAGSPKGMGQFHREFPETPVLFTEGSVYGLKGARKIIDLFRNGSSSYNAWVTIIDENKGPNNGPFEASETCITLNTAKRELIYHFDYYMYGQFMRFIQAGARRIGCTSNISGVDAVAFKNPDGTIVLVAVNSKDSKSDYGIEWNGQYARCELVGKSITTFKWSAG